MKKWKKPELKVLGVENTFGGTTVMGIPSGNGFKWVCKNCGGDPRNDINEIEATPEIGDEITTPNQQCGRCGHNVWIRVEASTPIPPYHQDGVPMS